MKSLLSVVVVALALGLLGCQNVDLKVLQKGGSLGSLIPSSSSSGSAVEAVTAIAKSGSEAFKEFSEAEEIALGEQLMSAVLGAAPLYQNDRVQRYVNQVGRWVATHSERPNLPWRFAVLDSPLVNAGAAPGGQIYITTGLLFRMRSESELAGALAHEIAHVVQRHQLTAYQSKKLGSAFATGAGALVDARLKTGELGKTVVKLGIGEAKSMIVLSLGRSEEEQADRMGMVLAARAGYDPYGLPATIQILQDMSGEQGRASLLYDTHPSPADRLLAIDRAFGKSLEPYASQATQTERFVLNILGTSIPSAAAPPTKAAPKPAPAKKP
jgi:beta-barrel assembly-enhancing protease